MSDLGDWDKSSGDEKAALPSPVSSKQAPVASSHGFRTFPGHDRKGENLKPKGGSPAPVKKKGNLKKKLAEREAEARRRALLVDQEEEESPADKRKRDKERQLQDDIDNAADLLGQTDIPESTQEEDGSRGGSYDTARSGEASTQASSTVVDLNELLKARPESKSDWEHLAEEIYVHVIAGYGGRAGFDRFFGPAFTKLLTNKLPEADMRSIATKLRDAAEKKVLIEKGSKFASKSKARASKNANSAKAATDVRPASTKTASSSVEPKTTITPTATAATVDVDTINGVEDDGAQSDGSFM